MRCSRCDRDQPDSYFLPDFKTCQECRSRKKAKPRTVCAGCEGVFPPETFRTPSKGRSSYCPDCRRAPRKRRVANTSINPTEVLGGEMKYLALLRRPLKP